MALNKQVPYKGLGGAYWRITMTQEDIDRGETRVTLALYASQAARKASPLENILTITMVTLKVVDQTRQQLYVEIKKLPDFKNAKDC